MRTTRITITRISYPVDEVDINQELQYLGGTLGLFSLRDKDKSRFRIFIALLKAVESGRGLSTDEMSLHLGLSRATLIHHLRSLVNAGIVDHVQGRYILRVQTLEELVHKIRDDVGKTLTELEGVARKCDRELGLG